MSQVVADHNQVSSATWRRSSGFSLLLGVLATAVVLHSRYAESEGSTSIDTFPVHHISIESKEDHRIEYEVALLELALNATKPEFGEYSLAPVSKGMTQPRAAMSMSLNIYENHIATLGFSEKITSDPELVSIPFPVFLGVVGHRVCFVSERAAKVFRTATELDDLSHLIHGFGIGWIDADIFESNGLVAKEVGGYKGLFKMVASGRIDTFCRGINEVQVEIDEFKHIPNLRLDQQLKLYYDLPLFFYTNKRNKELIERVTIGLNIVHQDGTLLDLWKDYFLESIEKANLQRRRSLFLHNPLTEKLPSDYRAYFVDLDTLN